MSTGNKCNDLPRPYLFCGYFECSFCHRPIRKDAYLKEADEWRTQLFELHCDACGHGKTNEPGSKVVHKCVTLWEHQVLTL